MGNIPHIIYLYEIIYKKSRGKKEVLFMISFAPFRKLIKERNISTYYLRNKCAEYNLDSKTIKRLMNDESVSTYTINSLCEILKCEVQDVMKFTSENVNIENR